MKNKGILNREINDVLGKLGHTDLICIADCGLPIPSNVKVIDLSIKLGIPSFQDVVNLIKDEMIIEKVIIAKELVTNNKDDYEYVNNNFNEIDLISHDEFKAMTSNVKTIIRTGANKAYANIILQSGCIF